MIVIYILLLIAFFPIINAALLMTKDEHQNPYLVYLGIFFSGPGLIICSLLLIFDQSKLILNRLVGLIFLLVGVSWITKLAHDILAETGGF